MIKKKSVLIVALLFSLTACGGGVSQDEYNSLEASNQELTGQVSSYEIQIESLTNELESKGSEIEGKNVELESVQNAFSAYQESMKPYEALSVAEAEAKTAEAESQKAEAERLLKEQQESEAAVKAAEEQAAAEEAARLEAQGYETGITYDQLARTPDEFEGQKVKFYGTVLQVLEGDSEIHVRLAIDGDYDRVLFCVYEPSIVSSRVLEDDYITVYGTSMGLYSYESSVTTITIPAAIIDRIDQ